MIINYSSHGSLRTIIANFRSRRVRSFPFSHLILHGYFFTQLPLLPPPSSPGRDRRKSCASRRTSGSEATREYESYDISDEKTHYESPHGSIFLLLSFYSYLRSIIRKLIRKQVCRKGKYLVTPTPKRPCHRNNLRFSRETSIVLHIKR